MTESKSGAKGIVIAVTVCFCFLFVVGLVSQKPAKEEPDETANWSYDKRYAFTRMTDAIEGASRYSRERNWSDAHRKLEEARQYAEALNKLGESRFIPLVDRLENSLENVQYEAERYK